MITLIIDQVIFILINMLMARWHAHLIEKGRPIQHGWWALGYGAVCAIFCWQSHMWCLLPPVLIFHKLVFDPFLNHWRRLPITYLSAKPKSILDGIEQHVFGRDWYRIMAFYLVMWLITEIVLINSTL